MHFASVVFPYMQGMSISPCLVGFGSKEKMREKLWRASELVGVLSCLEFLVEDSQLKWVRINGLTPIGSRFIHTGQVGLTCSGCGL